MTAHEMAKLILEGVKSLKPKKDRKLIAIAGPPGAGKSTVAEIVTDLMNKNLMKTSLIPMDGFHLDNKTLERENLLDRKGAPETFDIKAFKELIKNLRYKKNSRAPLFDRSLDEVIKNARKIPAEQEYIVAEGNYLLLNKDSWRDLYNYWDYKVFLSVESSVLKSRLIKRWLDENHTYSEAEARVLKNDLVNADIVNSNKLNATVEFQTG